MMKHLMMNLLAEAFLALIEDLRRRYEHMNLRAQHSRNEP